MNHSIISPVSTTPSLRVDISPQCAPSPHSFYNKLARVLWAIVWTTFFRTSPRPLYAWRRFLLRIFGARMDKRARVCPSVKIWAPWNLSMGQYASLAHNVDCYCVAPIILGDHATVSRHAMLCAATHDIEDPNMALIAAPIVIRSQSWICASAFIFPGVTIGEGAVVGACAVVTADVPPWTVVAGNPARYVKIRQLRAPASASDAVAKKGH